MGSKCGTGGIAQTHETFYRKGSRLASQANTGSRSDNPVTYRDLRNTPGKVFERLAAGEPLELVADGTTKALLIPVDDGDVSGTLDAWRRGRALLALSRTQAAARRDGTSAFALSDIDREIVASRRVRRRREVS